MKCLLKYQWVKLPRNQLPPGKGIMASWARLASRAAFRTGQARYCGYTNKVSAGGWAGGIVGLKSILAIKRRRQALELWTLWLTSVILPTHWTQKQRTDLSSHRLGRKMLWRALYGP